MIPAAFAAATAAFSPLVLTLVSTFTTIAIATRTIAAASTANEIRHAYMLRQ